MADAAARPTGKIDAKGHPRDAHRLRLATGRPVKPLDFAPDRGSIEAMSAAMKKPGSDLAQSEREAIVDLLHLCMYADASISIRETNFISDVVDTIGWDPKLSFSNYEPRSIAAARTARTNPVALRKFVEGAGSRLKSKATKQLAFSLCSDLMASDGTDEREARLLLQIRSILL